MHDYSQTAFEFSIHDGLAPTGSHANKNNAERHSREVVVDPIRLGDRGDISNCCSADLIDNGRIRKPFRYNGQLYITTSTITGIHPDCIRTAQAYKLVVASLFEGQVVEFRTKIDRDNGNAARSDPNGFYHGIPITYQSQRYVLVGPPLTFLPNLPTT